MALNDAGKSNCKFCGSAWKTKGLGAHERSCGAKQGRKANDAKFTEELKQKERQAAYEKFQAEWDAQSRTGAGSSSRPAPRVQIPNRTRIPSNDYINDPPPEDDGPINVGDAPALNDGQRAASPDQAETPEIKHIFHPHSKIPPKLQSFTEYAKSSIAERPAPIEKHPWRPFRSQLDFEVGEFCEHNMLNKDLTATLISLIRRCISNPGEFTLASQPDLDDLWELASHKCTEFERGVISIRYKNEDKNYDTYVRPMWDWILSLVHDPRLSPCFVWDAEKAYKFNGESYVRFYHEPWTADAFWAAQSALPNDPAAKPVCLVVYADKSKLSSFGTQKAYAVVARLANIPIGIRNSTGFGGGQLVGHQPIVKDDPQEKDKPAFSNFKNIVWHTAFYKLLESLVLPSKLGHWTTCGDQINRWLWPMILILAADYEEACVMALIRGLQGLYPCPICFVPWNEQSDLSTDHLVRTGNGSQEIVEQARAQHTAADRDELLKDNGLRDVDNVFWKISNTDPHEAISYDPLHADDGGLWGAHLFVQFKARVTELGRAAIVKIDTQMAAFPRWRGLNHFETVMNTSFNDGSKHEDIAKMILFVAHNILVDEAGLLLLQACRSYLETRTSIAFQVHTSETISAGRRELLTFDTVMKKYIGACKGTVHDEKNWNFPKFHARCHVFKDIENKGASRNFGTKTSESMHGAIRNTYHRLTNFKDVTPQLVKHDHRRTVATYIREQIDALDEDSEDPLDIPEDLEASLAVLSNVDIGSKLKPLSFLTIEQANSEDPAFERFRIKFGIFINKFLVDFEYNLPNGKAITFHDADTIVPFQFLKVHYESLSTWTSTTDYLRCNPKFNGQPRYDCVLVETAHKPVFARLLYLLSCTVEKKAHPFALILPLDAPTGPLRRIDKALRFHRVRAKLRKQSEFISVHSIIRGAVLVPDFDKPGEFIVFDVLDGDKSLRLKTLFP
ncbi:hypothetical protein DFH09DRAFT_1421223 [Mycena vulgaris]|nr:hypothetical protein DFH09DRAFT_1421223 [Mycena vulgaris]